MRLWYLSHRRPAKPQASLRICAVPPEPSLFADMTYGSRRRVRSKIRHLAPLDGCACAFEEWVYGGRKVSSSHELVCMMLDAGAKLHWMVFAITTAHIEKRDVLFVSGMSIYHNDAYFVLVYRRMFQ